MVAKSCSMVLLCGALLAQNPPPQDISRAPQFPAGTGRITGVVVAADNGAPVKRANVTIASYGRLPPQTPGSAGGGGVVGGIVGPGSSITISSELSQAGGPPRQVQVTDDSGRFEFTDLPAGRYSFAVMPQGGFVRTQRSQRVTLNDGGVASVAFKLERTGAIAGRIIDESGEPMPRVRVTANRPRSTGGSSSGAASATTDDLGQFRLFDLNPGEYLVSAVPLDTAMSPANAPAQGYGPTFYPGSPSVAAAQPVPVRAGQDTPNIMFSLARVALGQVSGTVRDTSGQAVSNTGRGGPGVAVALHPRRQDIPGLLRGTPVRPDGTFVISSIPPGDYYVIANGPPVAGPIREGAFAPVTINGDGQKVDLQLNRGATITGRVVLEGDPDALPPGYVAGMPVTPFRTSVAARNVPGGPPSQSGAIGPSVIEEEGTFELSGLRGLLLLSANAMPRAVVKSIVHAGTDLSREPVELTGTEHLKDVVVTITTEMGRIEGLATTDTGTPASDATIVVFSGEPATWFLSSPRVYITRSMPDDDAGARRVAPPGMRRITPGTFASPWLLPGTYYVAAIASEDGVFTGVPDGRDGFDRLRKAAAVVTVRAGQTAEIQVRVQQP